METVTLLIITTKRIFATVTETLCSDKRFLNPSFAALYVHPHTHLLKPQRQEFSLSSGFLHLPAAPRLGRRGGGGAPRQPTVARHALHSRLVLLCHQGAQLHQQRVHADALVVAFER